MLGAGLVAKKAYELGLQVLLLLYFEVYSYTIEQNLNGFL
jgi:hypothetical protein